MRYLLYTETFPSRQPGASRQTGIGRYCADLAWGLAGLGHDVTVLTNNSIGAETAVESEPFRVEILGPPPNGRPAVRGAEVMRRIERMSPDYVLIGDPDAHATMRRTPWRTPSLRCPILYGTEVAAWRRPGAFPRSLLRQRSLRRYLGADSRPVCISRFTASLLRAVLPTVAADCIVYPCVSGVCLSRPMQDAFGVALRRRLTTGGVTPLILVTVARISERKNQLAVLQALDLLRDAEGAGWHYVVLGNVDAERHENYFARLREFAADRGLTDRLTFVHNTTDQEKVDYLDACDASASISRTVGDSVEGFGISAIEASVRGKPVIVSDQGGMPETIVEGETGFAVAPDDIGRIADRLALLARDPGRRRRMGEQGRRRTLAEFTPGATAARLDAYLASRVGESPALIPRLAAAAPMLERPERQER